MVMKWFMAIVSRVGMKVQSLFSVGQGKIVLKNILDFVLCIPLRDCHGFEKPVGKCHGLGWGWDMGWEF